MLGWNSWIDRVLGNTQIKGTKDKNIKYKQENFNPFTTIEPDQATDMANKVHDYMSTQINIAPSPLDIPTVPIDTIRTGVAANSNINNNSSNNGLKSDTKKFFNDFSTYAKKLGHPVKIAPEGGFRTAAQQHKIYLRNKPGVFITSKDGYKKKSIHQSGLALDIISAKGYGHPKENFLISRLMRKYASQHTNEYHTRFIAKDPNHIEIDRDKYGLGRGSGKFKHGYLEL